MPDSRTAASSWVVVGLDNGGTCNNATVLDASGAFLIDRLVETSSFVHEGPGRAVQALVDALVNVLQVSGTPAGAVRAVGLGTPGPASAHGVISSKGSTNFSEPAWRGFDIRGALEAQLGLPVVYSNDANAAALYAHHVHFAERAAEHSSVAAIVGTGLGGGVVERGRIVQGAAGMAGEFGHIVIPMSGLLEPDQPVPACNCGLTGDIESVASLSGIARNLLPYWLGRFPDHELHRVTPIDRAAKQVRNFAERGDEMALNIFLQQAVALGRLFSIAANFVDPAVYFVGGGIVEITPLLRHRLLAEIRGHTVLREEQVSKAQLAVVPTLDMAGARGAALAARTAADPSGA